MKFVEKPNHKNFRDLEGQSFGRWSVLGYAGKRNTTNFWWCQCDCDEKTIKQVHHNNLVSNQSISCGCYRKEFQSTHKMTQSDEYKIYHGLLQRCNNLKNPAYKDYGGRGIKCLLKSFEEIINHIGHRPSKNLSIERIDNNGHYEVGNIRWATMKEQCNNRRNNIIISSEGKTKSLSEWAEEKGIKVRTIWNRVNLYNWCLDCSLNLPKFGRCEHL